jgi:hypothetical protein
MSPGETPPLTREERYLAFKGLRCPICESTDLKPKGTIKALGDDLARQTISCITCTSVWEDTYQLMTVDILEIGEPAESQRNLFDVDTPS